MKVQISALVLLITAVSLYAEDGFVPIFDGETLEGWHSATHPDNVADSYFSVNKNERSIHVYANDKAGTTQGVDALYTDAKWSNYVLKLQYKWADKRFDPRVDWDRDAGLLFHITGDPKKVWPNCLEMQIGESPATKLGSQRYCSGDLWVIGIPLCADVSREEGFYDAAAPLITVGKDRDFDSCLVRNGSERPHGEWNDIEIQVYGAEKAVFILNGEKVLEIKNMKAKNGDLYEPLSEGRIGLQAEFAELHYRAIRIKELEKAATE